jgi:hypothetical protein
MGSRTAFLSRLIGAYCILVPLAMMTHREASLAAVQGILHSPPVMLLTGIITIGIGLAIVFGHNVWSGGFVPVLVTLVGWVSLAKGMAFLFLTPEAEGRFVEALHYREFFFGYTGLSLLIGVCLFYGGSRLYGAGRAR